MGDIRFFKTQQWEIAKATVAIYVGLAAATGMMTPPKGSNIALVLRFAFTICAFLGMGFGLTLIQRQSDSITEARRRLGIVRELMGTELRDRLGSTPEDQKAKLLTEVTSIMNLVLELAC